MDKSALSFKVVVLKILELGVMFVVRTSKAGKCMFESTQHRFEHEHILGDVEMYTEFHRVSEKYCIFPQVLAQIASVNSGHCNVQQIVDKNKSLAKKQAPIASFK